MHELTRINAHDLRILNTNLDC